MRQRVAVRIERPPQAVFDFVAREHWRNHPRWDPNVLEIVPLDEGPIRAGSRARVRRRRESGTGVLEVLEFEPDSRWVSRNEIGPFTLEMAAVIEPAGDDASVLTLTADTTARSGIRYLLPLLAPVFRRRMRASMQGIKEMLESEEPGSG